MTQVAVLAHALPHSPIVSVIDLLIIYLACGSPFAVYRATRRGDNRSIGKLISVAATLLGWPIEAVRVLNSARITTTRSRREYEIESVRTRIEALLFSAESGSDLFDFRETFYRAVGLANAVNDIKRETSTHELFRVTNHPSKELASRCLARRNQARLEFHLTSSRTELAEVLSELVTAETSARLSELTSMLFKDNVLLTETSPKGYTGPTHRTQPSRTAVTSKVSHPGLRA